MENVWLLDRELNSWHNHGRFYLLENSSHNERSKKMEPLILYAPNQAELYRVVQNIQERVPMELVEKFLAKNEEDIKKCHIYDVLENVLFVPDYRLDSFNNGFWQAVMWALCALAAEPFETESNIFYSGCSFGAYWALTYSLYRKGVFSLEEALVKARERGFVMQNITNTLSNKRCIAEGCFGKAVLRSEKMAKDIEKKNEEQFHFILGKLILKTGKVCLFGKIEDLQALGLEKISVSIPFHSLYLSEGAWRIFTVYESRLQKAVPKDVILPVEKLTIGQAIDFSFFTDFDEKWLWKKVNQVSSRIYEL